MRRLTRYLAGMFARDALILFGVASFLLWLLQCLRAFDIVSVKGQGLLTLGYQGLLSLPPLVLSFAFVCVGIGLARALVRLQASQELHIIHTTGGFGALVRATLTVALAGAIGVLLISNVLEPLAKRQLGALNASITADLVSSTLRPGQFTQVAPGVLVLIGERSGNGVISEFFADDRRDPDERRTYIAESATVAESAEGYVLELRDGAMQTRTPSGRFSEIRFAQYQLNVDRFNVERDPSGSLSNIDSFSLVGDALQSGRLGSDVAEELVERFGEGLKVVGLCLLVLSLSAFPSGRRVRFNIPMEVVVLFIAFCDLTISSYRPFGPLVGPVLGGLIMTGAGTLALLLRARPRRIPAAGKEAPA